VSTTGSGITTTGLPELQALLARAQQHIEHPRELLEALGQTLRARIDLRLQGKRDPSGAPWAALAESTRAAYDQADTVRRGPSAGQVRQRGTLLMRSGQMARSLSVLATDDQVTVGMSRETAGGRWQVPLLHEYGTERMPRRGIFFLDPDAGTLGAGDQAALLAEAQAWIDALLG
jgi:phage gpG-like protein